MITFTKNAVTTLTGKQVVKSIGKAWDYLRVYTKHDNVTIDTETIYTNVATYKLNGIYAFVEITKVYFIIRKGYNPDAEINTKIIMLDVDELEDKNQND